jgi:hypothetical protein
MDLEDRRLYTLAALRAHSPVMMNSALTDRWLSVSMDSGKTFVDMIQQINDGGWDPSAQSEESKLSRSKPGNVWI